MMNDDNRFGSSPGAPGLTRTAGPGPEAPAAHEPALQEPAAQDPPIAHEIAAPEGAAGTAAPVPDSTAVLKFKSCRWRCDPEDGEFCTHRDVLPYAGKEGFSADSWCPECAFYKLRRTPKKRERMDYSY